MPTPFAIIPVLDLKSGVVVHARAGDRANYRPIATPLAAGSAPADILAGLLALAPFRAVYIADLDAIEGGGGHGAVLRDLRGVFPASRSGSTAASPILRRRRRSRARASCRS